MADYYKVTEAMIQYGGDFVSSLGKLYRQADIDNKMRLLKAFPEYFDQYTEIARRKLEQEKLEQGEA